MHCQTTWSSSGSVILITESGEEHPLPDKASRMRCDTSAIKRVRLDDQNYKFWLIWRFRTWMYHVCLGMQFHLLNDSSVFYIKTAEFRMCNITYKWYWNDWNWELFENSVGVSLIRILVYSLCQHDHPSRLPLRNYMLLKECWWVLRFPWIGPVNLFNVYRVSKSLLNLHLYDNIA